MSKTVAAGVKLEDMSKSEDDKITVGDSSVPREGAIAGSIMEGTRYTLGILVVSGKFQSSNSRCEVPVQWGKEHVQGRNTPLRIRA